MNANTDVVIIGAGASGLMCAMEAGKRGRRVVVLDHSKTPGRKIMMSGGGRCNFTNRNIDPGCYLSHNPHFCKSALSRYTQWDFIELVDKHGIAYAERSHGQLFCTGSARQILDMLCSACVKTGVSFSLDIKIETIEGLSDHRFAIHTSRGEYACRSLVVATGGLSMPETGASPLGYEIARQFGIPVRPLRAGLVPFTLQPSDKKVLAGLSGISLDAAVSSRRRRFRENILFTHRGLSGPAILQLSSSWQPGEPITIDLLPDMDLVAVLKAQQERHPQRKAKTVLVTFLPKRLVAARLTPAVAEQPLQHLSHQQFREIAAQLQQWTLKPGGTEGYRTAEVTVGGVDCDAISSKTMQARQVPGLFFTGEVLDVTGCLGGYNLQWAWSSGWCAGQAV
ncbi:NAD(P)/FAD-dependent oxidoreductase [uncultured Desulfosarcina sp.]|uniref:NAD(P)/FAD-dependent oxidoreductase n=1 Tax=uncultured Desulfosarcina sp. TaxID=218289 RepID=UPI0029C9488F|nr:NAD(P)/FAD-dependent oxidoreductase [uncultured Desulfosarcina sp.]